MQKINSKRLLVLMAVSAAFAMSSVAHGAGNAPSVSADEDSPKAQPTTIAKLAEKQKQLAELEIEAKIYDIKTRMNPPQVNMAVPSPGVRSPLDTEVNFQLNAVFGQKGNLRAEVLVDGHPYTVQKGSLSIPGWRVADLSNEKVVLTSGKKVKEVYLTSPINHADAPPMVMPPVPQMPNLPPVNVK